MICMLCNSGYGRDRGSDHRSGGGDRRSDGGRRDRSRDR